MIITLTLKDLACMALLGGCGVVFLVGWALDKRERRRKP